MSQTKDSGLSHINYMQFDSSQTKDKSASDSVQKSGLLGGLKSINKLNLSLQDNSKLLPGSQNPNSISSIFSKEYQSLSGVDRVFKKSIIFLIAHLIFFLGVLLVGLNWFDLSPLFNIFVTALSLCVTAIFYIIVADRSYVWISILAQAFLIIIVNSFYGQGFSEVTLLLALFIILLYYIAYTELEKVQLSSRLFSISHITSEANRILLTAVIIVISLGVFNSIISEGYQDGQNLGSRPFLDRVVLSSDLIMDNVVIGRFRNLSVNKFLMGGNFFPNGDEVLYGARSNREAVFRDFLFQNYEGTLMSETEEDQLRISSCTTAPGTAACDDVINEIVDQRLLEFKDDKYPDLPYDLDTPLTPDNFKVITKEYYLNVVENFESTTGSGDSIIPPALLFFPSTSIIPASFAIGMFLILSLFKFLFG
jgi:hypothetical protein